MLTLLIASAAFGLQSKVATPIVVPIKFFYGDPIISISIDVQSADSGQARQLSINGKNIGTADLEAPGANAHPVLNAIGLGVLNGMAIGIDYARNEIDR